MIRAAAIVAIVSCGAFGQGYGVMDAIAGPARSGGGIGNGKLTAVFDTNGRPIEFRWPSPSAPGQLTGGAKFLDGAGAAFALRGAQGTEWLAFTPRNAEPGIFTAARDGVEQTAWIVPDRDLAIIQLHFLQPLGERELVWFADFSPCTKVIPGIPSAEAMFAAHRDMFAFAEKGTVYHLRLSEVSNSVWDTFDHWIADDTKTALTKKDGGVWISYSAPQGINQALCAAPQSTKDGIEAAAWDVHKKAIGNCASAARIPVADDNTATLFIAFGERRRDVDDILMYATQKGAAALLDDTRKWWRERLAGCTQPQTQADALKAAYATALTTLTQCTERESGAIVRAPISAPPFAVDFPRLGAWATLALDLANRHDEAEKHITFYLKALRQSQRPDAPEGSIPAALYGSGVEAAPQNVLDVQGVAWLLWSVWQHDAFVPEADRTKYRESVWKDVESAGDFAASWSRAIYQTPAFSFEPARLSDGTNLESAALVYAGLRSASALAQVTGHDKPDWTARRAELEDYLRYQALNADGQFKIADPLALWSTELVGAGDPLWSPIVQRAIEQIPALPSAEAAKTLANLAMLLRDQKEMLARIEPLLAPTTARALADYPGDAYYAALTVTAILTVYSHGSF